MTEKLIIIVVVMIAAYFIMDKFLNQKNVKNDEDKLDTSKGEYTLEELAEKLWLKNERKSMPDTATMADKIIAEADKPDFVHKATNDFWENIIANEYNWIMNDERTGFHGLLSALKILLLHLDDPKYAQLSSVSGGYSRNGNDKRDTDNESALFRVNNTYDMYSKFSILTHSLGVAEEIIPIIKGSERGYMWGRKIGISLLCALGHDLGKIVRQIDKNENRTHEDVSADKLRELLSGVIDNSKIDLIANAIVRHHMENTDANAHYLITSLVEADRNRREVELKLHNSNTGMNLEVIENSIEPTETERFTVKIIEGVLELVEKFDSDENNVIFDRYKPKLLYISKIAIDNIANVNNIGEETLRVVMKRLRDEKIVSLIDFTRYDSYKLSVKMPGSPMIHVFNVIPFDYSAIGLTEQQLLDMFVGKESPEIVQNNQIPGGKQ